MPERTTAITSRHLGSLRAESEPSTTVPAADGRTDDARARALHRVCAGFKTTISARSAARLADLLDCGEPSRTAA